MKKLKLKYKIRRIIACILLLLIAYIIGLGLGLIIEQKPQKEYTYIEYHVDKGETMWSIANRFTDNTVSKWDYISACETLNNKQLGNLKAGEVILVIDNFGE